MKDREKKLQKIMFIVLFIIIIFFYLFPGNILGYIVYDNIQYQFKEGSNEKWGLLHLVINTGGYAINHFLIFFVISFLAFNLFKKRNTFLIYSYFIFFGTILEILHFHIPNRSFEKVDLLSNIAGTTLSFIFFKIKKHEV